MLNDQYLVRSKSSLTGKRVKHSAKFKRTREYAAILGRASTIAAAVYRQLHEGWKLQELYRQLTGVANRMLKQQEHTDEEVIAALWQHLSELGYRTDIEYETIHPSTAEYVDATTVSEKTIEVQPRINRFTRASARKKLRLSASRRNRRYNRVAYSMGRNNYLIDCFEAARYCIRLPVDD
ncbi:MAG: hypothetical protein QM731_06725 [Chitinophagaceae bacterium]